MSADKEQSPAPRFLTVGSHHYERRTEEGNHAHRRVPYVRLRGDWLQEAGFAVGGRVRIDVVGRCLVIVPDS